MKEKLGKYISSTYRCIIRYLNEELKDLDINYGQHEFLYVIMLAENGINQKRLSEILEIGKSTTAKTVKSLESLGYIRREIDAEDKRFRKIYITPKGESIRQRIFESYNKVNSKMSKNLSEGEVDQLLYLLDKVKHNLNKE